MSKIKDKAIFERLSGENVPFNSGTEWDGAFMPFADSTPKKISCFKCGKLIPQDSEYCPFCQTQLFVICPKCSYRYSAEYPSCYKCGTNRKEYIEQREREQREREQREREQREREQREREQREREQREVMDLAAVDWVEEKYYRFTNGFKLVKAGWVHGGYVLYNKDKVITDPYIENGIVSINATTAYLLEMLKDKTFTISDMANLLTEKYEMEKSTALEEAYTLVYKLKSFSVLEEMEDIEDMQEQKEKNWVKNYIKSHIFELDLERPNKIAGHIYNEYIVNHHGNIPQRLTLNRIKDLYDIYKIKK